MSEDPRSDRRQNANAQEIAIRNVMLATGLSRQAVERVMISDDELDTLFDDARSSVEDRPETSAITNAYR
jgi:hypothetical protein